MTDWAVATKQVGPAEEGAHCLPSRSAGVRALVAVFLALNVLDLLLTWLLLERSGGFYEANPLAAAVLTRHGWRGMVGFKLLITAGVLGVGFFALRWRPRAGRFLFAGGCAILLAAVGYSSFLLARGPDQSHVAIVRERHRSAEIDQRRRALSAYHRQRVRLAREMVRGHLNLAEATEELSRWVANHDHDPYSYLRRLFPELDDRACLSAHLICAVALEHVADPRSARETLARLAHEFTENYRQALPPLPGEAGRRVALFGGEVPDEAAPALPPQAGQRSEASAL
jgi:hypothetical protein